MSGKAASCAANVRPAGPQPMTSTSTSLGRLSELDDVLYCSDGSEISGLPVLNPLRWNCIGHFLRAAVRSLFLPKQKYYYGAAEQQARNWRRHHGRIEPNTDTDHHPPHPHLAPLLCQPPR